MQRWSDLADESGEDAVRRVLVRAEAPRAVAEFDREMAVRMAARLWRQCVEKRVIVDRLIARYRFSQATAYRIADQALEFSKPHRGEKTAAHDSGSQYG